MDSKGFCLHCCLRKGRHGGCRECGPEAPGRAVESHPLFLPPGTLLNGQYLIGRALGAGGFGITYLGVDVRLEHRVAVKEYMPRSEAMRGTDRCTVHTATDGDRESFAFGLGRFLEEARMLARISERENPRIVSVLNFFEANGTAYLVMRYLEGQPLSGLLRTRGGRLDQGQAVYIATAMLDGLREVHDSGLVHRDIKPQNVFITGDGGVKLIDFGAARYAAGSRSKSLTAVLTPPYAPHEQYYESGKQGPWTDLYAVGATLYQMLTGNLPPEAPARLDDDALIPASEVAGVTVSRGVSDAVTRALAPRPANRFRTVQEFQAALTAPDAHESDEEPDGDDVTDEERDQDAADDGDDDEDPVDDDLAEERQAESDPDDRSLDDRVRDAARAKKRRIILASAAALLVAALAGGGLLWREHSQRQADSRAFSRAKAEGTAAAMQQYLDTCTRCRHRLEAQAERNVRQKAEAKKVLLARLAEAGVDDDHPAIKSGAAFEENGVVWADAGGKNGVKKIQDAVDKVREGGLVVVRPGEYTDGFDVKKPIHVIGGSKDRAATRLKVRGDNCVTWTAGGGSLQRMSMDQVGGDFGCIFINGGSPLVAGNDLRSTGGLSVVEIRGGAAKPTVLLNSIHDGRSSGVFVRDDAAGTIEDNDIFANTLAGISIKKAANPTVARNKIRDGRGAGVFVYEGGNGTIQDNDIFANTLAGIEIRAKADPTVRRNKIHDGKQGGMYVHEEGKGTIEDNDIFANAHAGIHVKAGAAPVVRNNRIRGNGYEAVWVNEKGGGTFEKNVLRGNKRGAWDISSDSVVVRHDNQE